VKPLTRIVDIDTREPVEFDEAIGQVLTVNSDYHQMMLDLQPRPEEHEFLAGWRSFYNAPHERYAQIADLPRETCWWWGPAPLVFVLLRRAGATQGAGVTNRLPA